MCHRLGSKGVEGGWEVKGTPSGFWHPEWLTRDLVSDKDLLPDVLPRTATALLAPLQTQLQKRLGQPLMTYSGRLLGSTEVTRAALGRRCPPTATLSAACCGDANRANSPGTIPVSVGAE